MRMGTHIMQTETKSRVTVLVSDKTDSKRKAKRKDRRGNYIVIKASTQKKIQCSLIHMQFQHRIA